MTVVVCSLVLTLTRVPSVRNFDSNHEWKVYESEIRYARNSHQSQVVKMGQFRNDAPHNKL
jgi:hypothetical protein